MNQQKEDKQLLQKILNLLPEGFAVRQIQSLVASNQQNNLKNSNILVAEQPFDFSDLDRYLDFERKAFELIENAGETRTLIKELLQTFTPKYQIGDTLKIIEGLEHISFQENGTFTIKESQYKTKDGTVNLINIWASQNKSSQDEINHIDSMFEQNPEWSGKVKIIGISLDEERDQVGKFNQCKFIDHYRMIKGWDEQNHLLKFLHLNYPYSILINKWGKIVYLGNPTKDLKVEIEQEINKQNDFIETHKQTKQVEIQESLKKEEFQQLKQEIKKLQLNLKQADIEGWVQVKLNKSTIWKKDCLKRVVNRSKLQLSYKIITTQQDKLNQFIENNWNQLPLDQREIKEAEVIHVEQLLNQIKDKFQEIFSQLGVDIKYCNQETFSFIYDSQNQQLKKKQDQEISVQVDNLNWKLYQKGMLQIDEQLKLIKGFEESEADELVNKITLGLRKQISLGFGDEYQSISNYFNEQEQVIIKHQQGQVLLIVYWVDWCYKSTKVLKNNIELLKQNKTKWGNNVRFVFLSLVLNEEAKEYMDANHEIFNQSEFYFPQKLAQLDLKKYSVKDFPYSLIIDKFGIIRKVGKIDDVEQQIDSLLNETVSVGKFEISQENLKQTILLLENEDIQQTLINIDPQRILQFEVTLKQFGDDNKIDMPELIYFIRDSQLQQLDIILLKLFTIIPQHLWKIDKTISKTTHIPYPGLLCAVCKQNIQLQPQQYFSPFKQEHVCTQCAEQEDITKFGLERYQYHDTLVFINGPLSDLSVLTNIDFHKLGTNQKLKEGEEVKNYHYMICNGCNGEGIEGPRYISINAKAGRFQPGGYVDYCRNCFQYLKDKTSEKAKEIVAKDSEKGMQIDSLFTRVLFNCGRYREF